MDLDEIFSVYPFFDSTAFSFFLRPVTFARSLSLEVESLLKVRLALSESSLEDCLVSYNFPTPLAVRVLFIAPHGRGFFSGGTYDHLLPQRLILTA